MDKKINVSECVKRYQYFITSNIILDELRARAQALATSVYDEELFPLQFSASLLLKISASPTQFFLSSKCYWNTEKTKSILKFYFQIPV